MFFRKRFFIGAILLGGLTSISLEGWTRLGSREKAQEIARGRDLFDRHCVGCHNGKILTLARRPPLLNGIFQRKYLPSGALATDDQVRATIERGRSGIMPSFQYALSKYDIRDSIAYLHTLKARKAAESGDSSST